MAQSDSTTEEWDTVSHVISSKYRTAVLDALDEKPGTPSNLSERTPFEVSHVSRALHELQDEGLVELLVSEERKKGRIYGITDEGEDVSERAGQVE